MDTSKLPKFKYNPNVYTNGEVEFSKRICQCCGNETEAYVQHMYTTEDVDCICVHCVSNGKAANMFKGTFIQDADRIDNEEARQELFCRTPGYYSWQGESWAACCNDYCEYIGTVGTKELEELNIADQVFEKDGSCDGWEDARKYLVKDGSMCGYLFRCLHCKRYHLRIDAD